MSEPTLPLWELVQTSHVVTRQFRELFATHGLTPTQFGVLACLRDGDDFTKAQLARAVMVTPQSMDPLIDSLLARGLVERDGPPGRGRPAGIRITEHGRSITQRASTDVAALNTATRIGIPEHQIPELVDHLKAIREALTSQHSQAPAHCPLATMPRAGRYLAQDQRARAGRARLTALAAQSALHLDNCTASLHSLDRAPGVVPGSS